MSLEYLQSQYLELMAHLDIAALASPQPVDQESNALLEYAKGHKHRCRYLLSGTFERCGIPMHDGEYGNFSHVMSSAMHSALSRAEECELANFDSEILLGLSPYSSFGAEVVRVDSGYLVLISPVTFSFCFLYAILAIASMQAVGQLDPKILDTGLSGLKERLASDPESNNTLQSLSAIKLMFDEFAISGTIKDPLALVAMSGFNTLHPIYLERVQATYEHFIVFLVLHEFAHVALGHMTSVNKVQRVIPESETTYSVMHPLPKQEEEADNFALKALVGKDYQPEMLAIAAHLEKGETNHPELNKLWSGHTAYGRYTSATLMLKSFDLMDFFNMRDAEAGIAHTDNCEINHSHPSGQHRFIHAYCSMKDFISMPEGKEFSPKAVLYWSNFVTAHISYGVI